MHACQSENCKLKGNTDPSEMCAGKHISLMGHTHPYSDICAGKHASLGICVWGNTHPGETRIPMTPVGTPSESDSSDGAPEEDVQKKNRKDDMVVCKKKLDYPSESRVRFRGDTESPDGTLEGQRANEKKQRRDDRIVCKKKLFTRNRHDRLVFVRKVRLFVGLPSLRSQRN